MGSVHDWESEGPTESGQVLSPLHLAVPIWKRLKGPLRFTANRASTEAGNDKACLGERGGKRRNGGMSQIEEKSENALSSQARAVSRLASPFFFFLVFPCFSARLVFKAEREREKERLIDAG